MSFANGVCGKLKLSIKENLNMAFDIAELVQAHTS